MTFRSYAYDEMFDFKLGELPVNLHAYLGDQLTRARVILNSRNNEEIRYGLESLDWMLSTGGELLLKDIMSSSAEEQFISRPLAMRRMRPDIDLSDQSAFLNATWAEYFALLTLLNVVEWLYLFHHPDADLLPGGSATADDSIMARDYAVEAMEAVAYAECLFEEKSRRALAAGKGGKIKAKKYNDLKAKVIELYREYLTHHSNREAAKRIYRMMQSDVDEVLTADEPEKRLEIWIGKYKRTNSSR